MNRNRALQQMVMVALLCAVGIIIPMTFPKVSIPPMSFTLASHMPIFLAAFISPFAAVAVALGTTFGFFLSLPLPVVLRAGTHLIWAVIAAFWIKKRPNLLNNLGECVVFTVVIGAIHGLCEVLVLIPLYFGGMLSTEVYESGFFTYIILLVGVGTFVHSTVDFVIATLVWRPLRHANNLSAIASAK